MAGVETKEYKVFGLRLWQQVLIGLVLGIAVGWYLREDAASLKVLGTIFINLVKMMITPLIFFALVSGITSMDNQENFRRAGLKGFGSYLLTAMFAVVLGLVAATILQPGIGMNIDPASLVAAGSESSAKNPPSIGQFLLELIPTNAIRAMVDDHYIQVVVFAIFTGITINLVRSKTEKVRVLIRESSYIAFKMIEMIVHLAPIAVFGFMAWTVGTLGLEVVKTLAWLVVTLLAACVVQYIIFGVFILVFARLNPMPFYRKIFTTQLMAFSTSSSKATLTTAMREVQEKLGVSEGSANFLLPLGASINMDGTAIYLGICAVFFAQVFGVTLDMHDYIVLIITCTLGSIGAAGIPSGSIIFMGMVLHSVGLPVEGIGLILGVDRILDMVRTTVNITGDCAITLIVDKTEKTLNTKVYNA